MPMTIAAVMYSSVESNPSNTLLKSAAYPAGPVTYTPSPPPPVPVMARICSTTGRSSFQPCAPTLTGTTTSSAPPSLAGTGPTIWPLTWSTSAKRRMSAAALAWSAGVTAPVRSYTTTAGKVSLGVNRLARSTTWVDSAFFGSQADASFFCALFSLPASGCATNNTAIQKAKTNHLVHRPLGRPAILPTMPMTSSRIRHIHTRHARLILSPPPDAGGDARHPSRGTNGNATLRDCQPKISILAPGRRLQDDRPVIARFYDDPYNCDLLAVEQDHPAALGSARLGGRALPRPCSFAAQIAPRIPQNGRPSDKLRGKAPRHPAPPVTGVPGEILSSSPACGEKTGASYPAPGQRRSGHEKSHMAMASGCAILACSMERP